LTSRRQECHWLISRGQHRPVSSWSPSGLFKSAGEFLFSDTLDEKQLVGVDMQGNKYFEILRTFRADNTKQRLRTMEPATGAEACDYDPMSVPPEWRSWLNYSRSEPPTVDRS
jgi:NADH:ubiquinone oxidoreductase subunit